MQHPKYWESIKIERTATNCKTAFAVGGARRREATVAWQQASIIINKERYCTEEKDVKNKRIQMDWNGWSGIISFLPKFKLLQ